MEQTKRLAEVQDALQRVVLLLGGGTGATSVNKEEVLRRVLPLIAARTGHRGDRWKWSHVLKVLVDDGYVGAGITARAFARYVNELCPKVKADHVRNSVANNPLDRTSKLADVHYRLLPDDRAKVRSICIEIGELLANAG